MARENNWVFPVENNLYEMKLMLGCPLGNIVIWWTTKKKQTSQNLSFNQNAFLFYKIIFDFSTAINQHNTKLFILLNK